MDLRKIQQNLMKPQPLFIGEQNAFRSAVVVPLVKKEDGWHILFEVRSSKMRKQPGDISFPGGQIDDSDETVVAAAIRETYEELGVSVDDIHVIQQLPPLIMSSTFVVYPTVAIIPNQTSYTVSEDEVDGIFTIPLNWLIQHEPYMHLVAMQPQPNEDFPYEKVANGRDYQWRARSMEEWFYEYEGKTVWGLTARILKYFIDQVKE